MIFSDVTYLRLENDFRHKEGGQVDGQAEHVPPIAQEWRATLRRGRRPESKALRHSHSAPTLSFITGSSTLDIVQAGHPCFPPNLRKDSTNPDFPSEGCSALVTLRRSLPRQKAGLRVTDFLDAGTEKNRRGKRLPALTVHEWV